MTFGALGAYEVFLRLTSVPTMPLWIVLPLVGLEIALVVPYRRWYETGRALGALLAVTFVVDLIVVPLTLAAIPDLPVVFHMIYLLVITPATLASVPWGMVVTVIASASHVALVFARDGTGADTVTIIGPVVIFLIVGQQSVHYSRHVAQIAREADIESVIASALLRASRQLSTFATSSALVQDLAGLVRDLTGAPWVCVMLRDPHRGTYRMAGLVSRAGIIDEEVRTFEFAPGDFPEVLVARAGDGCVVINRDDPIIDASLRERWRLGAMVATALRLGAEPVGLLLVGMDDVELDAVARRLVVGIADQAVMALENARLVDDLRAASTLKTEFMATMSHELRSPLNAILGYVEILREEDGEPGNATRDGRRALLERVGTHSLQLLEMITATLDMSRLDSGRLPVVLAAVDLATLVDQMRSGVPQYWRKPAVTLDWVCSDPATIETDAAKVQTIVRNLVHNALKFTDRGLVVVRIGVTIDAQPYEDPTRALLEVTVNDTGIGIAPERQPAMFEMFRQGDGSDSRRHSGVGLGLYIVRRLVQALDGTIRVESSPGRGCEFRIAVPVRVVAGAVPAAKEPAAASRGDIDPVADGPLLERYRSA